MIYSEFNVPLLLQETETLVFMDGKRLMWRMGDDGLLVYLLGGGANPRCEFLTSGDTWTIRAGRGDYLLQAGENMLHVDLANPIHRPQGPDFTGPRSYTAA